MSRNPFGHVDVRVPDRAAGRAFYSRLLSALGFESERTDPTWDCFVGAGSLPSAPFLALTEDPEHRPNDNRVAFWAEDPAAVDRVGALLHELGATIESGPRACPEYSASYYAVFFRDPGGNALEVYYRVD